MHNDAFVLLQLREKFVESVVLKIFDFSMYGLKIIDENFNQKLCLLEKLKKYMEETRFKFFLTNNR